MHLETAFIEAFRFMRNQKTAGAVFGFASEKYCDNELKYGTANQYGNCKMDL